jgi:hypothetical protein
MKSALVLLLTGLAIAVSGESSWCADPDVPDPSPWSFLAGCWSIEFPDGTESDMTCELNQARNCYAASADDFHGTFGIDPSSDHPLLAIGYHPGFGYSVGHFKRVSDTVISGTFSFVETAGTKTEHSGKWEQTDYGYRYTVDGEIQYRWRRVPVAQPEASIEANLKPLARLVGSWNATFDIPDFPFDETKVTYRWVLDGRYLEGRWSTTDGQDLGPELFTWDPAENLVRMWGFDTESFYEATWQLAGDQWIGKYSGTRFSGEKTNTTVSVEFKHADSIHIMFTPEGATEPVGTADLVRVNPGD